MNKLRTGDEVIIISGKDKGKTGTLTKFVSKDKCIVMGLKIVKKHQKPNPQLNIAGGIIEKESPIHLSNIAIYNKKTKKADKVKIKEYLDNSLMMVTALAPYIGYDNASNIAKRALKNHTMLKEETIKSGLINEKDYNKIINPLKLTKPN